MKIYFLSSTPCALSFNDAYFGITDRFERFAEVSLQDRLFVRFNPENALPIGFFLTENILFTPPNGCTVYLLPDGIAIYAHDFPPIDFSLKVIAQERFDDVLITVYQQGATQLSIESKQGFFTTTLPQVFSECEISFHADHVCLKSKNHIGVYALNAKCVLFEEVLDVSISETELNATLPLSDSFKRSAKCTWSLSPEGCTRTQFTILEPMERTLHDNLLPFAFFESVLIGANFKELLSDELQPSSDKIQAFLGDFEAVTLTKNANVCGLVKKKAERLYEVQYYTVECKDGKITDIQG